MNHAVILEGKHKGVLWRVLSWMLILCLMLADAPAALGDTSDSVKESSIKTFIKLGSDVMFFTGATAGSGVTTLVPAGTVCMLVSGDSYTGSDGLAYYGVYYNSERYNVVSAHVANYILSPTDLTTYITGTLWKAGSYVTLRENMDLTGDVRVYSLQYALSVLGYYKDALDGSFGAKTTAAVKKYQKANGLAADGSAGVLTQPVLYAMALNTLNGIGTGGSTGGSTTGGTGGLILGKTGTVTTKVSVNLRASTSTRSNRLAVVPSRTTLTYIDSAASGGVTWYKVTYNAKKGWLMGTYVSTAGTSTSPAIGKVTITKKGTRVRQTANGTKTGTVLAMGTVVDLISQPTTAGGYTWYNIRTASGLLGYVRGDCATVSTGGSGGVTPSTTKTFVKLLTDTMLFKTETPSPTSSVIVPAGTVLQMVSTTTYTVSGITYCSLYYGNERYNTAYVNVQGGILSDAALAAHVLSLWNLALESPLKQDFELVGDVRVYAMQLALYVLGYYTGALDGNFGSGSASAVRNYQRKAKLTVDGSCGNETWASLTAAAKLVSDGSTTGGGSGGSSSGGGGGGGTGDSSNTQFGTVTSVEMATWTTVEDNNLFKKGTTATVMDVATGKVFTVYRWSGGKHADCVPYSAADTKTMCEIVNFAYNSNHPTSAQLALIKGDGNASSVTYTWPDFKNAFGGTATNIGSKWDRRAAWLNINGRVFCVSIYGFPHGFTGTDAFSTSKFPSGSFFYAQNNYYGMMCIHFAGSSTHSGTPYENSGHKTTVEQAYSAAKQKWPTLVK